MKKYRPPNGTDGEIFFDRFCEHCEKDKASRMGDWTNGCQILSATLCFNVDDSQYPAEWIYDENNSPTCTAFEEVTT